MIPPTPEPPHLSRLRRRIDAADGPVVALAGWPGSGRRELLEALARLPGHRVVDLAAALAPDDAEDDRGAGDVEWRVIAAPLAPEHAAELARTYRRRRGGGRLLLAVDAPIDDERPFPGDALSAGDAPSAGDVGLDDDSPAADLVGGDALAIVPDRELLLEAAEIETLFAAAGATLDAATVERLLSATGGWYGPLRFLAATRPDDPLAALADDAFAAWIERRALAPWPRAARRLLAAALPEASPANSDPRSAIAEAADVTPVLRLRLFGPAEVAAEIAGEQRTVRWRLRRAFRLVAYLALQPRREATREELAAALWPEQDEDTVRRNFHPTVSEARRALRQAAGSALTPIVHRRGRYRLNETLDWRIDVTAFLDDLDAGAARGDDDPAAALELLLRAWARYRGPLLADDYAVWIERPRAALHERHLELLRRVGELCVQLERTGEALDAYRALLAEDPFEERVHVAVMELYAARGRRDLVRRQFINLEDRLKELGVAPAVRTLTRYHELMC